MSLLLAVVLGTGACAAAALVAWLFGVLCVPSRDDRRYRDRPPLFWRIASPLVRPLAAHIAPMMSAHGRQRYNDELRRAGLDYSLSAEQYVAGGVVAAFGSAALVLAAWSPRGIAPVWLVAGAAAIGAIAVHTWRRDRARARERTLLRELPFYLDVITLAVESGLNLSTALAQAADKGPRGPLRGEIDRVLRDVRAGRPRGEALRAMSDRLGSPAVASLVSALLVAEKQGGALGPVLRAQSEQRRNERFIRAEKLAMEAPVKMLLPLLVFIFPCTFAILLFPIATRLLQEGWLK